MCSLPVDMEKWQNRMNQLQKQQPFTDEWWTECQDSLVFMHEASRKSFFMSLIMMANSM